MYPFGTDFTLQFTPLDADGLEIVGIPAQTAELFIYTSRPSRAAVVDETGHTATYTATWVVGAPSVAFSVTSIDDPDPDAEAQTQRYWYAVKFKLDTDEDQQVVIKELILKRIGGQSKVLTVTGTDLVSAWKAIGSFCSAEEMENGIATQKRILRATLKARGYEWAQIHRLDELKDALVFSVLAALMSGEAHEDYEKLVDDWKAAAKALTDIIASEVPYDSDGDGEPDTTIASGNFAVLIR